MAGTIDNSMIAIIMPEENVPQIWQELVKRTYPVEAQPWEKEATWAGKTEGMTGKALLVLQERCGLIMNPHQ